MERRRRIVRVGWTAAALSALLLFVIGLAFTNRTAYRVATNSTDPPLRPIETPAVAYNLTPEEVSFTTADGLTLRGWYIPPANGTLIVFTHGYVDNRTFYLPQASLLVEAGYGALLYDLRGHGESDDAPVTLGGAEQQDLQAALDFAAAQPGVERIGAMGFSMGGAALTQVAAQDARVEAAIVEAAYFSLEAQIQHTSGILGPITRRPALRAFADNGLDPSTVYPADVLCDISPRPLLLVYGEKDFFIALGSAETMRDSACPPSAFVSVPGASHQNFMEVTPGEYGQRVVSFFDEAFGQ